MANSATLTVANKPRGSVDMEDHLTERDIGGGFDQLDGEHRVQVGLLSALRDAVTEGRAETEVNEILERLVDYTKVHFMSEELLMRLYQYPHYEAHVAEHDRMAEQIEQARKHYQDGDASTTTEALDETLAGLIGHIGRSDQTLGGYLGRLRQASD
jgi:hemerythrin